MKIIVVLISLFAATQAQFFATPSPGATIQAGQIVPVRVNVPKDTVSSLWITLHNRVVVYGHLEYKNSDTWSRPHNWHCRLWTYLSRTICRPGWNPFRREIRVRGHKWQHTPVRVIRRLQPSSSQWHIWFSVVSSTAHLCNHAASKFVFFRAFDLCYWLCQGWTRKLYHHIRECRSSGLFGIFEHPPQWH